MDKGYWIEVLRFLHVLLGILWIGLLYYFNFVQIPTMPSVPAELKPGVTRYIAPAALFCFRWGAAFTVLPACSSRSSAGRRHRPGAPASEAASQLIGIGMWLA